ncbi:hypothetical protein ACP70R_045363 [Stipagrostis hirtigluma subsp. patula]
MAIDQQPLKRKRGRPAGSQVVETMELVKQRMALLDCGGGSSSEGDKDDDDFVPTDDELPIVVAQQPLEIHCGDTDDDVHQPIPIKVVRPRRVRSQKRNHCCDKNDDVDEPIPMKTVRARRVRSLKRNHRGLPQKPGAQNIGTGICISSKASDVNDQRSHASVLSNCGSAMARAKEIQAKLPAKYPSFIKLMLKSHVVRGFWLGLPSAFCKEHLPKSDAGIMLEDEDGNDHHTTYLGAKLGLSGGWAGFAIDHGLEVGDVMVFQLVKLTKFKVYIVRGNEFTITDGAPRLLNFEACKIGKLSKEESSDDVKSKDDAEVPVVDRKVPQSTGTSVVSESTTDDGTRVSDSGIESDDTTSFRSFNIVVGSLVINSKFLDDQQSTYYELCRSQKSSLHEHLPKDLNLTLVEGVIMETINIAERIRACEAEAASREDLLGWKKTLEIFDLLGMNVGFLLNRVNHLLGLPAESRGLSECEKYMELKLERARAGKKVEDLELQMSNVNETLRKMDVEMAEMESSAKKSERALRQLATAPW